MNSTYPGNGVYVVLGEISALMTSIRKVHWSVRSYQEEENNPLVKKLTELKGILNQISDLREIEVATFLRPFLEVIHSHDTTVQVTVLALSSVNKFIKYGLIGDTSEKNLLSIIENIADAVAHANFITADHPSDALIIMKIVEVLRTLVTSPLGLLLSNDSICEIMLSCFRICFEVRLSELLRQNAEHCLKDIVQLLFGRLPSFTQQGSDSSYSKKMRIRSRSIDAGRKNRKKPGITESSQKSRSSLIKSKVGNQSTSMESVDAPKMVKNLEKTELVSEKDRHAQSVRSEKQGDDPVQQTGTCENVAVDIGVIEQTNNTITTLQESSNFEQSAVRDGHLETDQQVQDYEISTTDKLQLASNNTTDKENTLNQHEENAVCEVPNEIVVADHSIQNDSQTEQPERSELSDDSANVDQPQNGEAPLLQVNNSQSETEDVPQVLENAEIEESAPLEPHNSICVQELLRFLSLICNPHDKQNTDVMIHMALSLLTVALEVGAEAISKHSALLTIIKETLCRNLLALLNTERLPIFAMNLHVSFLIFESMRTHLKFQLEYYLTRLTDIIILDTSKVSYEKKEMALESLVQLWRIPGFVTELFLNYDCNLYCTNMYEELSKLLSKNVYPVAGIYNTHLLSLDALLTVVESIERHCHNRISSEKISEKKRKSSLTQLCGVVKNETAFSENVPKEGTFQNAPTHEQLMAIKRKKKLLATGTEHFNANPKKGIQFLQEQGLLSTPLEPQEVATFLRENPHLDKKMIGEFISHRNNLQVLDSFVKSFDFTYIRIDEALRLYLETFRLPGESPLISLVMQHFADYWHKCNNEPFSKSDAAFVLAYAIIMLNVDQHNQIVRRQNTPMTVEEFKKNLKGVDGGKDFDQELLDEIYQSVKKEEIVMPAEHTGLVRENYIWKVLLRRGAGKDGEYIKAPDGLYDHELFSICWGPVITALGYVFDKANDSTIYYKAIQGFRKCATISAHYEMSNEFDFLTLSLCKFTTLLSPPENLDAFTISFGMNSKARLAARTVFSLVHRYGDILREGWKPVLDCIFQLFRCKLLPKILVEAEDFLELSGKVCLVREDLSSPKTSESGLLSSLYSYIALATEASTQRVTTDEEKECIEIAKTCIKDCHLENLILESKFLRLESLHELLKALIKACYNDEDSIRISSKHEEDKAILFLELLLKIVIQNRDRVSSLWSMVCDHMNLMLMAGAVSQQHFLVERCIIGYLRLTIRLMRREEISSSVLQSLSSLLSLKWGTLAPACRQIAYGLYELLKTSAANIHSEADWNVIFTLLEVVGAGAPVLRAQNAASPANVSSEDANTEGGGEDSGLGGEKPYYSGSDSSLNQATSSDVPSPNGSSLYLEQKCEDSCLRPVFTSDMLMPHDPFALVKCCESLAFLIRDVAHITPFNFESCIHCIRTFVEAIFYTGERKTTRKKSVTGKSKTMKKGSIKKSSKTSGSKNYNNPYDADESDPEEYPDSYYQVPLQLLDLMHTLHTRTAHIFGWWAEESNETIVTSLWSRGWCPLLQGIARFCCDPRKQVRMSAITYLQRALLVHDLQTLTADEWVSCFENVLFPLLEKLQQPINMKDLAGMEETRMRAATLLSKVFLHHLTPLQSLPTFTALWLRVLDFMDGYMKMDKSGDLLNEAVQESVKNMLLVMESAKLFHEEDSHPSFWEVTWERVDKFMPGLKEDLFRHHSTVNEQSQIPPDISTQDESNRSEVVKEPEQTSQQFKPCREEVSNQESILTRHSIPIFPHMGQLISTPIGPPTPSTSTADEFRSLPGSTEVAEHTKSVESTFLLRHSAENEHFNTSCYDKRFGSPLYDPRTSLLCSTDDVLPQLPPIRPHSLAESNMPHHILATNALRGIAPVVATTLPVYSGFSKLEENIDKRKTNDTAEFFYQNLGNYQSQRGTDTTEHGEECNSGPVLYVPNATTQASSSYNEP